MKYRVCRVLLGFVIVSQVGFSQSILVPEKMFPQLEQILASAVQQSPRMLYNNLDLEIAAGDVIVARSGLYPRVGSYVRGMLTSEKRDDIPGTLRSERLYYDLSLTQPLYHWGDVRDRAKIGVIREKIVQKHYAEGYIALAQQIRSTYLRLIIQRAQRDTAKFSQQKAEQTLNLAQDRLRNRVATESDVFPARISLAQAQLASDRAQEVLNETKRQFRLLTGSDAPTDDVIPATIPRMMTPEGEINSLVAQFLGQKEPKTLASESAKAELDAERLTYSITRHALRPEFNLIAGISQDQQSYTTNLAAKYGLNTRYIGISINWSIFDGFATRGNVRSSLARVRKFETNYKQLLDNLGTDAQRAGKELEFAERLMRIQDQVLGSAETFLTYRKDEFGRGTVTESDVANAQVAYNREHVNTLQQRAEYLLRASEFIASITDDPVLKNLPTRYR